MTPALPMAHLPLPDWQTLLSAAGDMRPAGRFSLERLLDWVECSERFGQWR